MRYYREHIDPQKGHLEAGRGADAQRRGSGQANFSDSRRKLSMNERHRAGSMRSKCSRAIHRAVPIPRRNISAWASALSRAGIASSRATCHARRAVLVSMVRAPARLRTRFLR